MTPEEETEHVTRALQNHPADFEPRDVQSLQLRSPTRAPIPPPQRTVFQPGSDWASSSTKTVLDALHTSYVNQAEAWAKTTDALDLSRCAGSVAVEAEMADLFDTQVGKPTQNELLEPTQVQCKNCRRPVLLTRFLEHRKRCGGEGGGSNEVDEQLALIEAPYGTGDDASSADTAAGGDLSPRAGRDSKRGEREREVGVKSPVLGEEDDWESTLMSDIPRYIPRGARSKRRRVALPPPAESAAQRKKNQNTEKKAQQAAAAAGILPLVGQQKSETQKAPENPIGKVAKELGDAAPWSKLMQVAMPITLPRNPKARKAAAAREQAVMEGMTGLTANGDAKGVTKGDGKEKAVANINVQPPSLVGSLMWIRAQGMKELGNTMLYKMDSPQLPIGRTRAMFHGQTYEAELGTYETDPRAQTTIKMPLTATAPPPLSGKPSGASTPTTKGQGAADRNKKQTAANHAPGTPNGVVAQQVPKKQRNNKAQRTQAAGMGIPMQNGTMTGKLNQNSRKAGGTPRAASQVPTLNVKSATNSYDSQHRAPSMGPTTPITASNATSAAIANATAKAAQYANQRLVQEQKKGFRPVVTPETMAMPTRIPQSLPLAAGPGGPLHMGGKPVNRPTKGRQLQNQVASNSLPMNRAFGGPNVKTPSPSQASSRSGERLPMQRGSPAVKAPSDASLMTSSMIAGQAALNRVAAVRGATAKGQLELQQALAQAAAAGRENSLGRASRGFMHHAATEAQLAAADKFATQMQRGNLRGVVPPSRVKYGGPMYPMPTAVKNVGKAQPRMAGQKDESVQQKAADLEAQLRRTEPLGAGLMPGKMSAGQPIDFGNRRDRANVAVNHVGNHPSKSLYSNALAAAASAQHAPNALNNQANLALFPMPHASQNTVAPNPAANATPNMLQNLHDMRALQSMGLVPGMQAGGHNANVLGFLPPGLSGSMAQTGAMNTGVGAGIPAGAIPSQPNSGMLSSDAILQQLLAGAGGAIAPNTPGMPGQAMNPVAAQLGHPQAHQLGRAAPAAPMARPIVQSAPNADIDEIDRALGLTFDDGEM